MIKCAACGVDCSALAFPCKHCGKRHCVVCHGLEPCSGPGRRMDHFNVDLGHELTKPK